MDDTRVKVCRKLKTVAVKLGVIDRRLAECHAVDIESKVYRRHFVCKKMYRQAVVGIVRKMEVEVD